MINKWVKCKDKLPPLGTEVIAYDAYRDKVRLVIRYGDAQYEYESNDEEYHYMGNDVDGSCYMDSNEVTAWQHVPRKPIGKIYHYKK